LASPAAEAEVAEEFPPRLAGDRESEELEEAILAARVDQPTCARTAAAPAAATRYSASLALVLGAPKAARLLELGSEGEAEAELLPESNAEKLSPTPPLPSAVGAAGEAAPLTSARASSTTICRGKTTETSLASLGLESSGGTKTPQQEPHLRAKRFINPLPLLFPPMPVPASISIPNKEEMRASSRPAEAAVHAGARPWALTKAAAPLAAKNERKVKAASSPAPRAAAGAAPKEKDR